MDPFFTTERLIARRFLPHDLASFIAARSDSEVARYQSWETFTETDARAYTDGGEGHHPGQPGWFQFALERRQDRAFVGDCGLRILESDGRLAQIGYTIARPFWGQGLATETVVGLVNFAFGTFPIHRIIASVDPRNLGSVRVLEKAGFTKEAHFRQSEWFKGEWVDDAIYALLSPASKR